MFQLALGDQGPRPVGQFFPGPGDDGLAVGGDELMKHHRAPGFFPACARVGTDLIGFLAGTTISSAAVMAGSETTSSTAIFLTISRGTVSKCVGARRGAPFVFDMRQRYEIPPYTGQILSNRQCLANARGGVPRGPPLLLFTAPAGVYLASRQSCIG
jgi:hypothetical protein